MFGRKTITLPTPPITPSISKSLNAPSGIARCNPDPIQSTSISIHSCGYCPMWNVQ